ncbi:MAG: DegT/DnrJ/EryC1/StrS family aminotransferase, partial [Proteobacteria bacterium]|nr:DegT/DnrJ/EryC1/StrS family aminotransferase [Pseudomonadota bacterium]
NLDSVDDIFAVNRRNHAAYKRALAGIPGISLLEYAAAERNSHHYVVVEVDKTFPVSRDAIVAALHAENILARKYFWPGCHKMKPYRDLFPHAELLLEHTRTVAERVIVLPNGVSLANGCIDIIDSTFRIFAGMAA